MEENNVEVNSGYKIQSRVMTFENECYVIGYNPKNKSFPYVTWSGKHWNDGWHYHAGFYCETLQEALNDLGDRISIKKYKFNEPTQVIFRIKNGCKHAGIAYHNYIIDGYDGKILKLDDFCLKIEVLENMPWIELNEEIGGDEIEEE